MTTARQNLKVQQWITVLSIALFVTKIAAWYLTHSLAILTDALESIVNIMAGVIGLYSLYVAAKPRDTDHPYGHGKAEFVSAAAEGTLVICAGVMVIYETILNFIEQQPIQQLDSGLILIAITAIINYIAGAYCISTGKRNQSIALQSAGKHLQLDTYSTGGIVLGLLVILVTHLYWLDKAIALAMGVFIIFNGYKILRRSLAGIMDEADMELLERLVAILNQNRRHNWVDMHNLRVIKYGSLLHVDCHLTVPWYLNVHEAHVEVDALHKLIRDEFGDAFEMFVHTDGCLPFGCPICIKEDCTKREHPFTHRMEWTLKNLISNVKHNNEAGKLQGI
ncbi:cation diffusion facilitator family transporter [Filimonas lacunae]|uniref:Cation diffusion facilitator family transporter n=1 Tax=Filimonas lacunae TaxID=477680 RepID=A0A173MS01_9BACT|nr:cobalt-zinc-cadmium resistance protein [Filimonas lacunae]SIT17378.1 cation diffusion facilitator family transporter [Filimonas lacunae]